ncbi:hypothetical protein D3C76_1329950 [compost metagenome]
MGKRALHKLGIRGIKQVPQINHITHGIYVLHISQKQQQQGQGQQIRKDPVYLFGHIYQSNNEASEKHIRAYSQKQASIEMKKLTLLQQKQPPCGQNNNKHQTGDHEPFRFHNTPFLVNPA